MRAEMEAEIEEMRRENQRRIDAQNAEIERLKLLTLQQHQATPQFITASTVTPTPDKNRVPGNFSQDDSKGNADSSPPLRGSSGEGIP